MNALQKLSQIRDELAANPADNAKWELAGRLLTRMSRDRVRIERLCTANDVADLSALLTELDSAASAQAPTVMVAEKDQLAALAAFKKRLKLTKLNDESKLAGRRLTSGQTSQIDAITPPTEFPAAVWEALAQAGKLKRFGGGFYGLSDVEKLV